jgi:hypothetical protein
VNNPGCLAIVHQHNRANRAASYRKEGLAKRSGVGGQPALIEVDGQMFANPPFT